MRMCVYFWEYVQPVAGNAACLRIGMSVSRNPLLYHSENMQNYTYTHKQADYSLHHMGKKNKTMKKEGNINP